MQHSPAIRAKVWQYPSLARRGSGFLVLAAMLGLAGCSAVPDAPHRQPIHQSTFTPSPAYGQCLADLGARAASFTPLPDQYYGGGCAMTNAVRLVSLSGDQSSLALTNLGPVTCPLANSFAGWARFGVDRAARAVLGSPLVKIETMGSYNCRNVAGTDHRSAHATGSAIDVSGFVLADGRRITVLGNWSAGTSAEREFLHIIEQSACKRFGTVLGPDYNPAHHNHFHVELSGNAFCH
jgi:hypothetical protein